MQFIEFHRRRWPLMLMPLGSFLVLAWCGCGPARAKPVNVEVARQTLTHVLKHWQQGGTIAELRQGRPEIVTQEPLWSQGGRLADFKLLNEGRAEDANWFCEVELSLITGPGDRTAKKTITYVVGTNPVLTVFHAML